MIGVYCGYHLPDVFSGQDEADRFWNDDLANMDDISLEGERIRLVLAASEARKGTCKPQSIITPLGSSCDALEWMASRISTASQMLRRRAQAR